MQNIRRGLSWEEWLNAGSHGVGLVLSTIGFAVLLGLAIKRGTPWCIAGCAVYGCTLVSLYLASTLYHGSSSEPWKRVLRVLDHAAIYLLIAGTYTPFLLVNLRGGWGWSLLGIIWGCAVMGVVSKACLRGRHEVLSTVLYIAMGWLIVVAIRPLISHVSAAGLGWLFLGGLSYTAGVVFFAARRLRFGHFVWHLFVLAGSVCHYLAIVYSVILTKA